MASTRHWPSVVAAIAAIGGTAAYAHHSGAAFDQATMVELRGVVVDFKLRSPHTSFVIDGRLFANEEPQGSVERWEVEWESAPMLQTLGVEPQTFAVGDDVTIVATPHRDRAFRFVHALSVADAFGDTFVMANSVRLFSPSLRRAAAAVGRETFDDAPAVEIASAAPTVAGRWQQPIIEFVADVPSLPLNESGMAAWRNYDPEQSPANACEPINVPDLFSAPFFLFDLRMDVRQAVLRHEAYGIVRTVPLDGAAAAAEPTGRFGSVSGRLENATLIVESRDYRESGWGLGIEEMHGGAVIPSSRRKTLTERFSVTPDGGTLVYSYTLYDPVYMSEPYSGSVELTRVPDGVELHDYRCDVESAAMWSRRRDAAPLKVGPLDPDSRD